MSKKRKLSFCCETCGTKMATVFRKVQSVNSPAGEEDEEN